MLTSCADQGGKVRPYLYISKHAVTALRWSAFTIVNNLFEAGGVLRIHGVHGAAEISVCEKCQNGSRTAPQAFIISFYYPPDFVPTSLSY